jgi:RND family efflux transporter MFP subunit
VTSDAVPGKTFQGRVEQINPSSSQGGRTFKVRIGVANPDGELKSGTFTRVHIHLFTKKNALVVPSEAVLTRNDKTVAFKVEKGTAVMTVVKVGISTKLKDEILSGLKPGDLVIVFGAELFSGGEKVTY